MQAFIYTHCIYTSMPGSLYAICKAYQNVGGLRVWRARRCIYYIRIIHQGRSIPIVEEEGTLIWYSLVLVTCILFYIFSCTMSKIGLRFNLSIHNFFLSLFNIGLLQKIWLLLLLLFWPGLIYSNSCHTRNKFNSPMVLNWLFLQGPSWLHPKPE